MTRIPAIVGIFALALAAAASAQSLEFGAKAGLDMATMGGDGWDVMEQASEGWTVDKGYLVGPTGGVFAALPLGEGNLGLQVEIFYVMKGAKGEWTGQGVSFTEKIKNDYIEIPVLISYVFETGGSARPTVFAGPFAAFSVGSKLQYQNPPESFPGEVDVENARSVDFGAVLGAGIGFGLGTGELSFEARYTMGLQNVYEDVDAADRVEGKTYMVEADGSALEFKNSDIRFLVGYRF
ncbi:MAG: PorT family protein [Candidatus Eisenbacteria bacterium]|nr:PorT family protein [Candidatus Eisenbacteria bacterium]